MIRNLPSISRICSIHSRYIMVSFFDFPFQFCVGALQEDDAEKLSRFKDVRNAIDDALRYTAALVMIIFVINYVEFFLAFFCSKMFLYQSTRARWVESTNWGKRVRGMLENKTLAPTSRPVRDKNFSL